MGKYKQIRMSSDRVTETLLKNKKGMNIQQTQGNDENYKFFDSTMSTELQKVRTLDDEQIIEDKSKEQIIIFDKIQYVRNLRWSCCTLGVFNLLILFGFVFILIYFLFFRTPHFRIEQIQITEPPSGENPSLGINIIIQIYNPNLQSLNVERVELSLDLLRLNGNRGIVLPKFSETFKKFAQTPCSGRSYSTLNVTGSVPLSAEQSQLVILNQFGFEVNGNVYYYKEQHSSVSRQQFILGN